MMLDIAIKMPKFEAIANLELPAPKTAKSA